MAREQAQAEAKLEAALKATGYTAGFAASEIKDQAAELQKLTGIGDETIISMQAMLASFKNIRGDTFQRATMAVLDMGAAMKKTGQSQAQIEQQSIQVGKALNDPILGLTALSRVGVTFTDQQKETIKALVEGGEIAKAQGIILKELESEFGGTAKAMGDASHGVDQMKSAFGDAIEQVGKAIVESEGFDDLIKKITDGLERLVESGYIELWAENVRKAIEFVAPAFRWVGRVVAWVYRQLQRIGGFIAGFVMAGGGLRERFRGGVEMARIAPEFMAAQREQRLAQIRKEREEREKAKRLAEEEEKEKATAARLAREQAEKEKATAARLAREQAEKEKRLAEEKLAAEKKRIALLEKEHKIRMQIAKVEQQLANKRVDDEHQIFQLEAERHRRRLDAPEQKTLRQRLQMTAEEQKNELARLALSKEEARTQEQLRRDIARDERREEELRRRKLRGVKLSKEDEMFLAARRAAEQREVELANVRARERMREQREIRALRAQEAQVKLLKENLQRVGN
jgi:hypothetical protein